MRIAVFSDLHGNPFALDALLADLGRQGPFDRIIAAGDLAFGGSDPAGCVDRLRDAGVAAVYGNTELYICSPDSPPPDELHLRKWDRLREDALWIRERLGEERIAWLAGLPFDLRISPTGETADDLLVFHANPVNVEEMLLPPPGDQVGLFGRVVQPDSHPDLVRLLGGAAAAVLAFGHYHYSSFRKWRALALVNVSPASMPAKDHDPRTRYSIFTRHENGWDIDRQLIDYDYTQEVAALARSGLPHWRDHAGTFPGR